jgi:DNA-binding MarR family transcriptional regulator
VADINVSEVVYDPTIYPRVEWSQATVNRYAEALNAGDEFPPIVLEPDTNRLLDGMHRWQAHKQALRDEIRVVWQEVPEGVPAKLFAASLSAKHGDRIKGDELKTIAREIAEGNPDYDLKTIAKYSGVTRQTVSKWVGDIVEHRRMVRKVRALLLSRAGWSNVQIGEFLGVTEGTVRSDVKDDISTSLGEELIREAIDGLTEFFDSTCEVPEELLDRLEAAAEEIRQERIFASWSDDERDLLKQLRSGETVVVTLRGPHNNLIAWADAAGLYVRIDRRGPWGNPFELPGDGTREQVIANYENHYLPYKPSLLDQLHELKGKALGCWCAPEACHGDILKNGADEL